ncbi:uncharacterized protein si:ch211-269k10.4 isoform X2 [Syngnathoides biaculeatus]|nr:uncharacterized protein si:ch211-269k10.4 isoform X2 [Syngnathoides biaculeatus]XP_061676662.1 uncharacterized protein si:ch211-269k10.4 isoform X2 [Syngnathoides biaculeatus]
MACPNVDMAIQEDGRGPRRGVQKSPRVVRYQGRQVAKVGEDRGGAWTSVLGSMQVVSGLLSVGLGLTFAVSLVMTQTLLTLFRVSHLTGVLFIIAGLVSNMLLRYPVLITVSLTLHKACILVAIVAVALISTDLIQQNQNVEYLKLVVLEVAMLGLQLGLSVILCLYISKGKSALLNN